MCPLLSCSSYMANMVLMWQRRQQFQVPSILLPTLRSPCPHQKRRNAKLRLAMTYSDIMSNAYYFLCLFKQVDEREVT